MKMSSSITGVPVFEVCPSSDRTFAWAHPFYAKFKPYILGLEKKENETFLANNFRVGVVGDSVVVYVEESANAVPPPPPPPPLPAPKTFPPDFTDSESSFDQHAVKDAPKRSQKRRPPLENRAMLEERALVARIEQYEKEEAHHRRQKRRPSPLEKQQPEAVADDAKVEPVAEPATVAEAESKNDFSLDLNWDNEWAGKYFGDGESWRDEEGTMMQELAALLGIGDIKSEAMRVGDELPVPLNVRLFYDLELLLTNQEKAQTPFASFVVPACGIQQHGMSLQGEIRLTLEQAGIIGQFFVYSWHGGQHLHSIELTFPSCELVRSTLSNDVLRRSFAHAFHCRVKKKQEISV